jgi:SAM-dependent methyltransferase
VACGTGVLARTIAERVGASGSVVGLDVNDGMLAVAARTAPHIEWRQGAAEALPFDSASFDAVVSQFGMMFFTDRRAAVREMVRVLRPRGRLAVAVWDSLDNSPGYSALVKLLQKLFGDEAANALRAPFVLGDVKAFKALFDGAGLTQVEVTTHEGTTRFPSLESWMYTEIKGWTLADMLDDAQYERLLKEAKSALSPFMTAEGSVAFSEQAHILSAEKAV